jgi:mycothiol system anti-sigma-R factor
MADCNETLQELDAFLDGELSPDIRSQIHHHLGGCVGCNEAYDFYAELRLAIQRKCTNEEMPDGLMDRIRQCFDTNLLDPDRFISET